MIERGRRKGCSSGGAPPDLNGGDDADEHACDAGRYEALAAIVARGSGEYLSDKLRQLSEEIINTEEMP